MKKRLLIMAAALMAVVMPMRAQDNMVFTEDFETTEAGQMPEGWTVYGDGMANHSNYASFGDSWQVYDFGDLSKRALSISWKADAVASDRWMVTPAIALPAGGNPRLKFDTWGYDDSYPEQYKVMVSTTGTAKEDFALLYDISAVAAGDATHMTSLAAYAGQTVYLAFVNYGDGYYGEIDNIQVGEFAADGIELMHVLVPSHVPQGEELAIQLRVRNTGAGMLNSFTYVVVAGSDTVQGVMSCMLSPYEEEYYVVYVPATALGTLNISATVLLPNGNADPDASDNAAVATTTVYDPAQTVERTALVELFNTAVGSYGANGDQIIAGAVAPYADNVVWITHHSGYYTDSMTSEISQSMVELFGGSSWAPALAIDRNAENVNEANGDGVVGSYGNAETNIPAALQRPAFGTVSVSNFVYDTNTRVLMAAIDVELLIDISDPRINLYIVEDGIVGSQASAGGTISDYVHNNVVRGAITGTWGDELSVSNGHASALYNYTLPAEWDASHCRLVAFVSEYGDGVRQRQVINATQTGYLCGDQGGSTPVETDTNINTITVVNDGGGFLIYSNDYESWYLMGGDTATFTGVPGQSLWIQTITASPVSSYYDPESYPGSRLNSILMDGEQVAIDGTDSRVTVGDLMATTGYIYYEMAVSFDAPHTLVFSYGPYVDASVCDVAQGLTTEVTGNTYATLRWIADQNGHDDFSVSISQDGVALSIEPQYSTSGNYHYCTFEGLTAGTTYQVAVTNACGVANYEFTTYGDMHSVVFENQGGGFMQYRIDNGQFFIVADRDTVNGYDGARLLVRTMTDQGAGYAPEGAEVFQSLYVDGQEAEMDAYQQDGYIMYLYYMDFDANHTVTAVFAPAQTDTTVVPGGDTTVTAECVAPQNLIWGNSTDEGFATMWDMPEESGVTYYVYLFLGEQLVAYDSVTDENYYEFHDLQPLTDYLLVVARLCPEGPQTTTENVRTLGEAHTITINNEGRGLVRNYSTNERYFDTTFTRYAGGWLNLVFYSFAPETGLEYGWENYQLQHFYVDGAEVTLADDSNSVYILRAYDYMAENGYMVYLLSIRTDADHTLRFVYGTDSSYVPEQHTITVFNHGRGYMDDQTYQGYGYFTQNVNVLTGTASDNISLRIFSMPGAQAAAYGFGTDSTMLVGLAIDGETIAIDGSDSRLTVNHHEDGTIGYTYNYLYFDADHTVEAWFAPWEQAPVVNHTLSLHNQGGGYMYNAISGTWFYGDTTMTVQEGYYTRYQIVSFDPDTAESFGIERDAAQVKHIYVNGVDVMVRYTDTSHTHYWLGYGDRMADAGYEVFNLYLFFERDLNVVVEFGPAGEAPQPCTPDTVYVTETVHDTVYVPQTVYDTVYVPQTVHDTVRVVEYVYIHDTVYADTLRIYVHDTVVDTVYVGLDDVEDGLSAKLYSRDGQIVVEGAEGAMVVLYDAVGRQVALRRDDYDAVRFDVPASGTYLVRIGNHAARRIVVVK